MIMAEEVSVTLAGPGDSNRWLCRGSGANAMNMYFDRDIDEMMRRTRGRPVPAGGTGQGGCLRHGDGRGRLSVHGAVRELACSVLTLGAFAFYVVVYTLILKRTTSLNIVSAGRRALCRP
jgi:protoheme IX farnesyltransferase